MNTTDNTQNVSAAAVLAERVTARVSGHEATMRAAVRLTCTRLLLPKIGTYVEADGWIDWPRLAGDLIRGLPWSGGEKRLARIACSLSGQMAYLDGLDLRDVSGPIDFDPDPDAVARLLSTWSLSECLYGLDADAMTAVLDALHFAAGRGTQGGDL